MTFSEQWLGYLKDLRMPEPFVNRVLHLYEIVSSYAVEPLNEIFVSEYVDEDGSREFESVWLFGEDFTYELKSFTNKDHVDMAAWRHIKFMDIELKDYELGGEANDASRVKVNLTMSGEIRGDLRASGENCEKLAKLVIDKFAPRMKLRLDESRVSLDADGLGQTR